MDRIDGSADILFQPIGHGGCGQTSVYVARGSLGGFTDQDLGLLDNIRLLRGVDFNGSRVSLEGVRSFKRRHPTCRIVVNSDSL